MIAFVEFVGWITIGLCTLAAIGYIVDVKIKSNLAYFTLFDFGPVLVFGKTVHERVELAISAGYGPFLWVGNVAMTFSLPGWLQKTRKAK